VDAAVVAGAPRAAGAPPPPKRLVVAAGLGVVEAAPKPPNTDEAGADAAGVVEDDADAAGVAPNRPPDGAAEEVGVLLPKRPPVAGFAVDAPPNRDGPVAGAEDGVVEPNKPPEAGAVVAAAPPKRGLEGADDEALLFLTVSFKPVMMRRYNYNENAIIEYMFLVQGGEEEAGREKEELEDEMKRGRPSSCPKLGTAGVATFWC